MTDIIEPVTNGDERVDQPALAEQLLAEAQANNVELIGAGGLLNQLTKRVLEAALEAEMTEHLGYDKHDPAGRGSGNSRNGVRPKTVLTEIGPVDIDVPRDTDASFTPRIVRKRQRRLDGVNQTVLSLGSRGLTTGEISAQDQPGRTDRRRLPGRPSGVLVGGRRQLRRHHPQDTRDAAVRAGRRDVPPRAGTAAGGA